MSSILTKKTPDRRTRLADNPVLETEGSTTQGSLYQQFKPYFNFLLETDNNASDRDYFRKTYINNMSIESGLTEFIHSPRNQILAFTGPKGSGKSTTIRYLFGETDVPSLLSEIHPNVDNANETLIIPFLLDSHQIVDDNHDVISIAVPQILAACDYVQDMFKISVYPDDFHTHIKKNAPAFLNLEGVEQDVPNDKKIKQIRKENPYGYAAERIKFILNKSDISRVIIIVDDIESAPYNVQRRFIKGLLSFRDCLNLTSRYERRYRVEFLFTCRPVTFRLFKRDPIIDGFPVNRSIKLTDPVDLEQIVQKRFEFAINTIGEGRIGRSLEALGIASDLSKWNQCIETFNKHIADYTERYGGFLLGLCNNNIRDGMVAIQDVLENSRWYEDPNNQGAFDIREKNFRTTEAGFLRSLVLKNHDLYQRKNDPVMANMLANFHEKDADLFIMYMLKMFIVRERASPFSPIKEKSLRNRMEICFPETVVENYFDLAVSYCEENNFVYRYLRDDGNVKEHEIASLPKIRAQWSLMRRSSVVLEFSRDDCWLSHESLKKYNKGKLCSTSRLEGLEKFSAALDLMSEKMEADKLIFQRVMRRAYQPTFFPVFGRRAICSFVLEGIENSASRYFRDNNGKKSVPASISRKIYECKGYVKSYSYLYG